MTRLIYDTVVIGGGIAGLWTLNRLCNRGFNAILLESNALGSYQTIASQGMIHGGIKYTLGGALTGASEAIADMPDHWRACLRGDGDVNLRGARILSDHFYLWSTAGITSKFSGFIASRATRGRVEKVPRNRRPAIFDTDQFHGSLYRLVDVVVDTASVLRALADNFRERIFRIDWEDSQWVTDNDGRQALEINLSGKPQRIETGAFVFSAGKGNGRLLEAVNASSPAMQLRPLHQVMVRHRLRDTFYGHCVTTDATPRLTISSHPLDDGHQVWYLGGTLAEKGVKQTPAELIATAKAELDKLIPWVDLTGARWATLRVERAEPKQRNLARPDAAFAQWAGNTANVIAAWPTKLTLSPHMAMEVENRLAERGIGPGGTAGDLPDLPHPGISPTPWQEAFDDVA